MTKESNTIRYGSYGYQYGVISILSPYRCGRHEYFHCNGGRILCCKHCFALLETIRAATEEGKKFLTEKQGICP